MSDIAIKVEGIGKRYKLGHKKSGDLRESFSNLWNKIKTTDNKLSQSSADSEFWALKDISFTVNQGEAVGIIGRNGAGKSTLLKVLSRITVPTQGRFEINGRVSSLLEVGTGFHPELTGRENIYLNGTILGMRRAEIKAKFDEIVAFSGVEEFIDTPVKHYSSGMKVRLAFSVAAHLEPEILIIDEVLAVGDADFQKKCLTKMEDVTGEGRTVLFVSHNMGAVEKLCGTGILLENGKCTTRGEIQSVIAKYIFGDKNPSEVNLDNFAREGQNHEGLRIKFLKLLTPPDQIVEGGKLELEIEFVAEKALEDVVLGFTLSDNYSTLVESRTSAQYKNFVTGKGITYKARAVVSTKLVAGLYQVNLGARFIKGNLEYIPGVTRIEVLPMNDMKFDNWSNPIAGKILIDQNWKIE